MKHLEPPRSYKKSSPKERISSTMKSIAWCSTSTAMKSYVTVAGYSISKKERLLNAILEQVVAARKKE